MNPPEAAVTVSYPAAERLAVVDVLHGQDVPDPYRWLEDPEDERTQSWLAGQDTLYEENLAGWDGVDAVGARLRELLGVGVVGVPIWRRDRRFFMRREGQQEHSVLFVAEGDAEPRVLLDPMAVDPTGLTTLDTWQPSIEGDLLAYQLSESGSEESVLRVMDVATGEVVDGPIDRARYSPVAWLPGGSAYYYVRRLAPDLVPEDERQYHRRVWLHEVGSDPDSDTLIFGEGRDLRNYYGVGVSRDGRWLTVSAAMGTAPRNDVWLADLSASSRQTPGLQVVVEGLDAQVGIGVGRDGRLYVSTDLDSPRGRVAVTDPTTPGRETWHDLLPEDPEAVLEDFAILDGPRLKEDGRRPLLLVGWTRHAVSEITVHDLETGERLPGDAGTVRLPGLGTIGGIVSRIEGGHEAWFGYTDHTTPPHVYRYDGLTGEVSLFSRPPGTVEVPGVVTRQVTYTSKDGTAVRMFLTARADLLDDVGLPNQPLPTILYGYGGFGVSLDPGYSGSTLTWAEAGGLYAVANLRGGGEEGESWHRDGMLGNKQNVYDDFYAAAGYLLDHGWTTRDRLSISGGSNGGLLVGVALTQRPDLFRAVVCSAPLLDMIRYEQFGLGATWNEEYGTVEKADEFGWLLGYSPYHHVAPGTSYPATLFTIFDSDTRVDPLHARKLAAALQHAVDEVEGAPPILLRREKDVGHGARALSRTITLSAQTLAFAAHWTGLGMAPVTFLHSSCVAGEVDTNSWICNQVYDWTEDIGIARVADAVLGGTFKVLTIIIAAIVIRFLVFRVIDRVINQIATSPSGTGRPDLGLTGRAEGLLAVASPMLVARRAQRARTLGSVLKSVTNVLIGLISVLMVMEMLGYPIGPLLASAGIVGVALGFGAQTIVKDFISGIFMLMEDQFGVGDLVDMGEAIGTVEAVSLRITRLRDGNGAIWYMRNGEVLRVQNQSQGWAKATVDVLLAPDVDLTRVTTLLITVAQEARQDAEFAALLRDDPEIVSVESITPAGANMRLQMTTQPLQGVPASRLLRVRVHEALAVAGIPLAHPAWPTA